MPELPEVETVRRQVEPVLAGALIERTWDDGSRKFLEASRARGRTVLEAGRRGKYLVAPLDDGRELIVHLGMTGQISIHEADAGWEPSGRFRVALLLRQPEGAAREFYALLLADVRGFGKLAVREPGEYDELPTLAALGVEPFSEEFTARHLHAGLQRSTQPVYQVLLNQRIVTGLGNIYVTEALHNAGVSPRRAANRITRPQAARLRDAIVQALAQGVENCGTTLRDYRQADGSYGGNLDYLVAYGRAGGPCHGCGKTLSKVVLGGRTAAYCTRCQR